MPKLTIFFKNRHISRPKLPTGKKLYIDIHIRNVFILTFYTQQIEIKQIHVNLVVLI
jgi:hypothetical protein